jgi:ATP/maltotriose-dependent transcriptional regulator MalT
MLAAWRGREADVARLIDATTPTAVARCDGQWLTAVHWANAVLSNGIGRYEDALAAAEPAAGYPQEQAISQWALPELIEAAVRCGRPECATGAMRRLTETTRACGLNWGLGVEAYSRALLSDGEAAETLHREAIVRLSRAGVGARLARAHLVYGEWLRRENRRLDAREQLRTAYRMLGDMGIAAFAERARRELVATGETVRRRTDDTRDELTAQEAQIARLAGDGWTNPEIGAQLFISPRTVEWHLRKIFGKLDISSRKELGAALPEAKHEAVPV